MSAILSFLFSSQIAQIALGAIVALAGLFGWGKLQQAKGKKRAESEHAEADADEASAILRRVRESDGVPDDKESGYRD